MSFDELDELFGERADVIFLYNSKSYLMGYYTTRRILKKNHSEYWFCPPMDDNQEMKKFVTFSELLNHKIGERTLGDIISEIEIDDLL